MRDYSRYYKSPITELYKWRLYDFVLEYTEAASQAQEEQKAQQKAYKAKSRRR